VFSGEVIFPKLYRFGYPLSPKTLGYPKGKIPLALGDPIGASGALLAHDFARKVVCVIPFATAGDGKGVSPPTTHLPVDSISDTRNL